ncbi:ATR-interacting protein [Colossoma macropomum]|uniref:ATR-interacting protein n=1 Tax=Colossoma macropomum TaxID=42526 RepID=UPI00186484F9|nr:ATR-interacting protein [Colossoma macropomum]XP_036415143.1 ATR-interacting protein [Colossoma macropomum]
MEYPPSKRLKALQNDAPVEKDPFGDDEDFTQDDLEEIDIIASQAITGDGQLASAKRTFGSISSYPGEQSKAPVREGRKTFSFGSNSPSSSTVFNNMERQRNDVFGNGQIDKGRDELYYSRLEAQQAELKRKLKEVEDQILMKNGEIRVLRDSLRLANQEKEQQRQTNLALEREKVSVQSEKEKELSKKVESLQSELHFKEAEMNEMRSKLQSSERGGRLVGTPVRNNTNSPGSHAFVTKETFSAELSVKPSTSKCHHAEGGKQNQGKSNKEAVDSDAALNPDVQHKGPFLLNLLLQHPLEPSSLGLCHLLCLSPEALPCLFSQSSFTSPASSAGSSTSSTDSRFLHRPRAHFFQLQSLAMSGLTVLAHGLPICSGTRPPHRTCPAAVHLLPLLNYHISLYCQTLESIDRSGKSPLRGSSLSGSSESSVASTIEESLSSQEEFALAAMKALYHIVTESSEATHTVLCGQEGEYPDKSSDNRLSNQPQSSTGDGNFAEKVNGELQAQHPLLKRLFQLVDVKFISSASQKEAVMNSSFRAVCALAERAEGSQLWRLKVLMSSQVLAQSLSLESPYTTVCLSVRLLTLVADCEEIATKVCSLNNVCPLVRVFQYITSRPEKSMTEDMWSHLDVEVVRLLAKLFTQKTPTWAALISESSCQCSNEVVRTVVVVLHRQWLSIKGQEKHVGGVQAWTSPGVQLLREALMLLHWLLLNDSSFSLHCLDVLHIYHQVIPAIRDTLRKIPDLSESEELAIEEICRPEADVEDMDIDAGS